MDTIPDDLFALLTRYCNQGDNETENLRRAEVLGLGGRHIRVAPGAIIRVKGDKIGRNVFIGLYTYVNGDVTIEDDTLIGPHCSLTAGHHKFDPATGWFSARTEGDGEDGIRIGRGSWLATGVTVTAGVHVGRANLICANAVVTRNTPDYALVAGTPARVVGHIDPVTGEYHWHGSRPPASTIPSRIESAVL